MKYKIVIAVLTYNPYATGQDILSQCLDSIYKNTDLTDTHVIVGNNSEDPQITKKITELCSKYPNLTLLNFNKDLGTTKAWNIMTRKYDNEIIVHISDDVMVYPYWLKITRFVLENNPGIGSVSYDMWYTNTPYNYNVPKDARIWANEAMYPLGCAFALRREVYDKIGGFDEQFFMGYEDVDLGITLVKLGYFNFILGTANAQNINEYHPTRHIGGATGYPSTDSGQKFTSKHNIPFPLNPDIEGLLKRQRNKNINLSLPRIAHGDVIR